MRVEENNVKIKGVEKMRTFIKRQPDQTEEKKVLNFTEAARYMGIKRKIFLGIIASGELPFRQVGRMKLFTRAALDRWLRGE